MQINCLKATISVKSVSLLQRKIQSKR